MRVSTGKHQRPRRTLIYGPRGTGKSTFASRFRAIGAEAPDVCFIPLEEGLNDIDAAQLTEHFDGAGNPLPLQEWDEVNKAFQWLAEEEHSYKHVALDSIDWLQGLASAKVLKEHGKDNLNDFEFGKGWQLVHGLFEHVVRSLDWLRLHRGIAPILIAHEHKATVSDPALPTYQQHAPKLRDKTTDLLCEWCDELLFATFKVYTREEEASFGRTEVKACGKAERILSCWERPGSQGKNRLNLPQELALSWQAYQPFYHGVNE